jgi:DNA-binding MarR family transcriptional regulator
MSQNDPLEELYRRPGFMIRRVHQIAGSLFIEETGKLNRQYGILFVIMHRPGIDQISVANLLGLDRSTTGMVLKKLEEDGLVVRSIGTHDRRRHSLRLTRSGERLLSQLAEPARRAQARVLSAYKQAFAKIKHWMRAAQKRTVKDTWRHIGSLVASIEPRECSNYFANAGYASVKE